MKDTILHVFLFALKMSKEREPLLFQLPHAWLIAFLSEWLDMPTLGRLDSAISTMKYRAQFLNSLQSMLSTSVDSFSDPVIQRFSRNLHAKGAWTRRWWRWLSIRHVYVERATLVGSAIDYFLTVPSIKELTVEDCNSKALLHIAQSCPALRSLTIRWQKEDQQHFTEAAFESLARNCGDLEEINYDCRCYAVTEEYYEKLAAALVQLLRRCAKLKKVSLTGNTLRRMKLEKLHPFGHLLHELEFGGDFGNPVPATGQAISNLLTRCVNLRKVDYYGGMSAADEEKSRLVLTALRQSCPLLEEVQLFSLPSTSSNAAASDLRRNCTRVQTLTLHNCKLSDSCLRDIAGMESLQVLTLRDCRGWTDAGMTVLGTLTLTTLSVSGYDLAVTAFLQSSLVSNISHTLESFALSVYGNAATIDDVQVANALASCHNLKKLSVFVERDGCVFGRNGLDGLQAMATGCPLLADVSIYLIIPGIHCLGTHFTNLKKCYVRNRRRVVTAPNSEEFPSIEELQTLYPAVTWT
jgi:hypothetical protein